MPRKDYKTGDIKAGQVYQCRAGHAYRILELSGRGRNRDVWVTPLPGQPNHSGWMGLRRLVDKLNAVPKSKE